MIDFKLVILHVSKTSFENLTKIKFPEKNLWAPFWFAEKNSLGTLPKSKIKKKIIWAYFELLSDDAIFSRFWFRSISINSTDVEL